MRCLVFDADVLIDYATVDSDILRRVSQHLGTVKIPSPVLDEVERLSAAGCQRLGLVIVVTCPPS